MVGFVRMAFKYSDLFTVAKFFCEFLPFLHRNVLVGQKVIPSKNLYRNKHIKIKY